jgi:hypothetical protein
MSAVVQRPEHLIIREYVQQLRDRKLITQEGLCVAFVSAYVEMIPPGEDAPAFDPVHRHDSVDQARKKDQANLKKLWRAIDGATFFPLAFKAPLIVALERIKPGLGDVLQKRLLHNCGLLHMPVDTRGDASLVYSELLREFAEANTAMVTDLAVNGRLDQLHTREELLDSVEAHLSAIRELDKNTAT